MKKVKDVKEGMIVLRKRRWLVARLAPKKPISHPFKRERRFRSSESVVGLKNGDLFAPHGVKGARLPCGVWGKTPQNHRRSQPYQGLVSVAFW